MCWTPSRGRHGAAKFIELHSRLQFWLTFWAAARLRPAGSPQLDRALSPALLSLRRWIWGQSGFQERAAVLSEPTHRPGTSAKSFCSGKKKKARESPPLRAPTLSKHSPNNEAGLSGSVRVRVFRMTPQWLTLWNAAVVTALNVLYRFWQRTVHIGSLC